MEEKKTFMSFLIIVFAVNLLVNLYIFTRTRAIFPAGTAWWWAAFVLFWFIAFSYAIGRVTERTGAMELAEPFVKLGSYWLGAMVYLTLLFLLTDILRGINAFIPTLNVFRFNWLSTHGKWAVVAVYAATAVILTAGYFNAKIPKVSRQTIQLTKPLPEGNQKVVLVSDIHLGMMISNGRLQKLVTLVNKEEPDLIFLAGDIFDEDLGPVIKMNMGDLLKNLKSKHGTYAVLGNHEFYGNAEAAHKYMEDHRITVLRDTTAVLPNGIIIAGREDITSEQMSGIKRKSIAELLAGMDTQNPVFMLDHQPYKLREVAAHGIDLQVSGHTHNGQMWPFNYITGNLFEISKGYGQIQNTHFFVSSGFGTWGPPIRTNSRSEIVVLEIRGQKEM